jgi:AcrR family transcriptional regulator
VTKKKILNTALTLFNNNGIINVRLQHIADKTGISVGNLAYHFNNKEAIIESLINNVINGINELLKGNNKKNSLDELDHFFIKHHQISDQYKFFIFDILEIKRNYPEMFSKVSPLLVNLRAQLEKKFNIFLKERLVKSNTDVKIIVSDIMLLLIFMHEESKLSGKDNVSELKYRKRLWNYIALYFTDNGSKKFNASVKNTLTGKQQK